MSSPTLLAGTRGESFGSRTPARAHRMNFLIQKPPLALVASTLGLAAQIKKDELPLPIKL